MKYFFTLLLFGLGTGAYAQLDTMQPAYKRYPTLPPLQLLLVDSITKYTKADLPKKKPVLIMLFSPDCDHCQQEAEAIATHQKELKNIHIIMISSYPIYRMKEFAEKNSLSRMENVVIAKDPYRLLPSFYAIRNFPFLALYDRKGNLIEALEGSVHIDKLLELFNRQK